MQEAAQRAREEALREQVAEEERRLAQQRAEEIERTIVKYQDAIKRAVERHWRKPPSVREGLSCVILVQLIPSGDVRSVRIVEGSGNAAFDQSAERAVYAAAPFTVPDDPAAFGRLSDLQFVFKPEV